MWNWVWLLAYVTGKIDQEVLLRNEYLFAENRVLRSKLPKRIAFTDKERRTLGEIAHRLGKAALAQIAQAVTPETLLGWHRRLVAQKYYGSKARKSMGRPRIEAEIEQMIVHMAKENRDWGYDRIFGALSNLGYQVSDQTVGNVLARHGIPPVPERRKTGRWLEFIRAHKSVLSATDFFTVDLLTPWGIVTYYVLFFIHLESRNVTLGGITEHPNDQWMQQIARNVTMEEWGCLNGSRYLIHDGDMKFTEAFRKILRASGVEPLRLPPASPNLNAFAERWVRSIKAECLSKLILFGESSLRRAIREYLDHYHTERNHQGKGNVLLFPNKAPSGLVGQKVDCRERLGGLLKYYEAA